MSYLIFQTHGAALPVAREIRELCWAFGIERHDVLCPYITITRRKGACRDRVEEDVALLEGFIFVRDVGSVEWVLKFEQAFAPKVRAMRREDRDRSTFATCTIIEIERMQEPALTVATPEASPVPKPIAKGAKVRIAHAGHYFNGVTAEVLEVRKNGHVKIKLSGKGYGKLSTLLVHHCLLALV